MLFVDDDRDDIELTLLAFHKQGFEHEVSIARDGRDALDRLHADYEESRPMPGLIVTDLKMPRMDGLEMLRQLKDDPRLMNIPVIFLTSSGDENDRAQAMRSGASDYLKKPSALDSYGCIVNRVRELIGTVAPSPRDRTR